MDTWPQTSGKLCLIFAEEMKRFFITSLLMSRSVRWDVHLGRLGRFFADDSLVSLKRLMIFVTAECVVLNLAAISSLVILVCCPRAQIYARWASVSCWRFPIVRLTAGLIMGEKTVSQMFIYA